MTERSAAEHNVTAKANRITERKIICTRSFVGIIFSALCVSIVNLRSTHHVRKSIKSCLS